MKGFLLFALENIVFFMITGFFCLGVLTFSACVAYLLGVLF